MMTWLLAEKANNGAVTAKRDTMWASARAVVIPHVVVGTASCALNGPLRQFALASKMRERVATRTLLDRRGVAAVHERDLMTKHAYALTYGTFRGHLILFHVCKGD